MPVYVPDFGEIGAVLKVVAGVAGAAKLVEVSQKAYSWMRARARMSRGADEAKEVLGLTSGGGIAYRHDSVHALYSGSPTLHPDNLAALTAAAGGDFARAANLNLLRRVDAVRSALTTNLVLIGSPTAEGLSRPTFGYEADVDADSLDLKSPPLDLPIHWMISKKHLDSRAIARRYVAGKGLVSRPNWRIDAKDRLLIPEVDSAGFLMLDYLVVTRVRNFLSQEALDEGKYIVSFGGAHGTATRAIELLLKDKTTLSRIAERLSRHPPVYQLLLRVGGMEHNMLTGTRAREIELVGEPIILPDTEEIWQTAMKIAKGNLDRWLESQKLPPTGEKK